MRYLLLLSLSAQWVVGSPTVEGQDVPQPMSPQQPVPVPGAVPSSPATPLSVKPPGVPQRVIQAPDGANMEDMPLAAEADSSKVMEGVNEERITAEIEDLQAKLGALQENIDKALQSNLSRKRKKREAKDGNKKSEHVEKMGKELDQILETIGVLKEVVSKKGSGKDKGGPDKEIKEGSGKEGKEDQGKGKGSKDATGDETDEGSGGEAPVSEGSGKEGKEGSGEDGKAGKDGQAGHGKDGKAGKDGQAGHGKDGKDKDAKGKNGKDGKGKDGKDGEAKEKTPDEERVVRRRRKMKRRPAKKVSGEDEDDDYE